VLAVVYLLVFNGLPAATAWRLMAHLTADHHAGASRHAHDRPAGEPPRQQRHSHAAKHARGADHHHAAEPPHAAREGEHVHEAAEPPAAASAAHEHGGTIHTHEMDGTTQPHLTKLVLAKHYPLASTLPRAAATVSPTRHAYPGTGVPQTVLSVETPPPRRTL
jgi:hypothetical protein